MIAAAAELRPASFIQQGQWRWLKDAPSATAYAALGLVGTGTIDDDRLAAAVHEVAAGMPALRMNLIENTGGLSWCTNDSDIALSRTSLLGQHDPGQRCVELMLADRDRDTEVARDPLVRFHLVRLSGDDVVLGLIAHRLVLDGPARFMVLSAIWQAYFGRYRPSQFVDFAAVAALSPVAKPEAVARRQNWWAQRLQRHGAVVSTAAQGITGAGVSTVRRRVSGARWRALTAPGGMAGGSGSLVLAALTAWWLRESGRCGDIPCLRTEVDLRSYLDQGAVIGPLSDYLVFDVDLSGLVSPSFRDVMLRTRAGYLEALVHYLPYAQVVDVAVGIGITGPDRAASRWDVTVHICQDAPVTAHERRERMLREIGVFVGLFREAELLGVEAHYRGQVWDGTNIHLTVGEENQDSVLVLEHNRDPAVWARHAGMLEALDAALDIAIGDPDMPLVLPVLSQPPSDVIES